MIIISGRYYNYKGTYNTWQKALHIGKSYKRLYKKRWYIKKTSRGYDLYVQQ